MQLSHKFPNDFGLSRLGNEEILGKSKTECKHSQVSTITHTIFETNSSFHVK